MGLIILPLVLILVITVLLHWFFRYYKIRKIINKIPGFRDYFIIGNIHLFKPGADAFFEQANAFCSIWPSPRMTRFWLLWQPYLVLYGADECEAILSSNKHLNKSREYKLMEPWLGLGLITSYAEQWRPQRKLLTPAFHYDILKDFVDVFNHQAKILVKKLDRKRREQQQEENTASASAPSFDIYPYICLCALDIICESAMGINVNAQQDEDSKYVQASSRINQIIHERQKAPWFWPDIIFTLFGHGKEHQKCLDVAHGFTYKVVKERRFARSQHAIDENGDDERVVGKTLSSAKRRLAFLDLLLDMEDKNELTFQDVCDEVNTFMSAGHDTTSASMSWTLYLLGLHPEIQAKVHQELDQVLGGDDEGRDISFDDLKHLTYLECCVKESLRLYPSVPMILRNLEDDTKLVGYEVPQSCVCLMFPYAVHRDPRYWPEPETFDPDRFLPDNSVGRHPFAYLPFSAGARNCIGQRFAYMEEKTVLAWLLSYFTVEAVERRDQIRLKGELILRASAEVKLKLKLRKEIMFEENVISR